MARRKKRSSRKRSRRMGATKMTGQLMNIVGLAIGAGAGKIVATKLFPNMDEKIKNVAVVGLGAFLFPKLIKGGMGQNIGAGMVASGTLGLLENFKVIQGVNDYLQIPVSVGAIDDNISVISGMDNVMAGDELAVLAGEDEDYDV